MLGDATVGPHLGSFFDDGLVCLGPKGKCAVSVGFS